MTNIAKLDTNSRLIGIRKLRKGTKVPDDAIIVEDECDLPTDGTYYWNPQDRCFMPLGHGHGRPGPAPVFIDHVIFLMAKAMPNPPQEVLDWVQWMEELNKL